MAGYYVYIIGVDGHIQKRINVLSNSDEEAKTVAEQYVDGHAVELWQQKRKIAEFKPKD